MKSIGILGGIGYKATAYFYERINYLFEQKVGKGNSCPILLHSINFKEINELLPNQIEKVAKIIKPEIQFLDNQNIVCAVLVNNTMHKALDIVLDEKKYQIPYCHVGELITEKLNKITHHQDVLILGTAFTMNDDYLKSYVPKSFNVVIPDNETIEKVDQLRQVYIDSIDYKKAENVYNHLRNTFGSETIFIIACTELSIAFADFKKEVNWIDTLDLQAEKAINLQIKS